MAEINEEYINSVHVAATEIGLPAWAWLDLKQRYGEPHRAYHTLEHVFWALWTCNEVADFTRLNDQQQIALRLAILYHDYAYRVVADPGHNETVSAVMGAGVAQYMGLDGMVSAWTSIAINATATHIKDQRDPTYITDLMIDCDLAGLASRPDDFDANTQKLKEEYVTLGGIPLLLWVAGRINWIDTFLQRDHIYYTAIGRDVWEPLARQNLAREREELKVVLKYLK